MVSGTTLTRQPENIRGVGVGCCWVDSNWVGGGPGNAKESVGKNNSAGSVALCVSVGECFSAEINRGDAEDAENAQRKAFSQQRVKGVFDRRNLLRGRATIRARHLHPIANKAKQPGPLEVMESRLGHGQNPSIELPVTPTR
jgi:hypothetical protein